jgi:ferritin
MTSKKQPRSKFYELLQAQVNNEFNAAQQYIALAVWFDKEDLPQLAKHFYRQAVEERNHALAIVQYLLDTDHPVDIPGTDAVRNDFSEPVELIELALRQEKDVAADIETLAKAASVGANTVNRPLPASVRSAVMAPCSAIWLLVVFGV